MFPVAVAASRCGQIRALAEGVGAEMGRYSTYGWLRGAPWLRRWKKGGEVVRVME